MEYREAEALLAKMHQVDEADIGAFRARLRVLRDHGIPKMPRVGKGARVHFFTDQIAEMHLSVILSEFGVPPARIALLIEKMRTTEGFFPLNQRGDWWLVITMRANAGKLSDDPDNIIQIVTVPNHELTAALRKPPADAIATGHLVLDLQRIAEDLTGIY